jgi:hypothetical protein
MLGSITSELVHDDVALHCTTVVLLHGGDLLTSIEPLMYRERFVLLQICLYGFAYF